MVSQSSSQIRHIKPKNTWVVISSDTTWTRQNIKILEKRTRKKKTYGDHNNIRGAQDPCIQHFIFVPTENEPKSAHEPQNKVYYRYGNTRYMKLKSITIENLLSFENSEFNFKEYNVIVAQTTLEKQTSYGF